MREYWNRVCGGVDAAMVLENGIGTVMHEFVENREIARFGGSGETRARTIEDLYRYPIDRSYGRGLSGSGVAWSRGVEEKQLSEGNFRVSAVEFGGVKSGKEVQVSEGLVFPNVVQMEVGEKEEGELEEGEIVMGMDEVMHEAVEEEDGEAMHLASPVEDRVSNGDLGSSSVTDCVNEESFDFYTYWHKFGSYERLPSPTPSEDIGRKEDDCSGEVSSASKPVNSAVSTASIGVVQMPSTVVATSTAVSVGVNPTRSTTFKSRDPRRLYAASLELKQTQLVVGNTVCMEASSGSATGSKSNLNRSFEGSDEDGPASKRQRTGILYADNKSEINTNARIQLKPRDPRREFLNGMLQSATLPERCSAETETKKNGNVRIPEDQSTMKPVSSHVTTPEVTRKDTENKNNANTMRPSKSEDSFIEASDIQTSATAMTEHKTNASSTSEDSVTGASRLRTAWSDVKHLFEDYDDHQIAKILKERERRFAEQKKMFAERKLCLVLDLDHTLLNSAKFSEIDPVHEDLLRRKEEQDSKKPYRHLFRLPHMALWTKLRPGIWSFLEKASKLCELHVCTMGNKSYASEMAKILDPKGVLFAGRVISKGDDGDVVDGDGRVLKTKDLEGVLGMETSIVIVDDCKGVWPYNSPNLIAVERYIYFPCSRRQFGLPGPSLLEIDHDERPGDGALASSLAVIERLHETFFSHPNLDDVDVRHILAAEQRKILSGCRIVFSHVFPVAEANPHLHPLWKMAEQLGASCTNRVDDKVTHVVANSPGTDKVKWALSTGRFVVRPNWVEASALLYRRANEQNFPIKP